MMKTIRAPMMLKNNRMNETLGELLLGAWESPRVRAGKAVAPSTNFTTGSAAALSYGDDC
jgi:hypothetical protein